MKILLIDDLRNETFIEVSYGLRPTNVARTYEEGIRALKEQGPFDLLYLDHDLGEADPKNTGYGVMCFLEANPEYLPKEIHLVTSNPVGRKNMMAVIDRLYKKES